MSGAPHSKCNFLTDDKRFLIGAMPNGTTLKALLKFGVTLFVNLVPGFDYKHTIPANVKYIHLPIPQGGTPSDEEATSLAKTIQDHYNSGGIVYIHCVGGNGRAGTISGLSIGKMWGWDAPQVIAHLEKRRSERSQQSSVPIPETSEQVQFLAKHLGIKSGHYLQSRPGNVPEKFSGRKYPISIQLEPEPEQLVINNSELTTDKAPQLLLNYKTRSPLLIDGVSFSSAENALTWFKYNYPGASSVSIDFAETVRKVSSQELSEKIKNAPPARADWKRVKGDILFRVTMAKFKQDTNAKNVLLSTGTTKLIDRDADVALALMKVRQLIKID